MRISFRAVRFLAPNYRECVAFYRDVLGFPLQWGNESTAIADFEIDGVKIAICDAGFGGELRAKEASSGSVGRAADQAVLVLRVDDLDEACEVLRKKGVKFVSEPEDFPELHVRAARLRDPAGNLIEINVRLT